MDRLNRSLACCGLVLILAASGCRTPRPEVPPGHAFANDGAQAPPVRLSSEPPPAIGPGAASPSLANPYGPSIYGSNPASTPAAPPTDPMTAPTSAPTIPDSLPHMPSIPNPNIPATGQPKP